MRAYLLEVPEWAPATVDRGGTTGPYTIDVDDIDVNEGDAAGVMEITVGLMPIRYSQADGVQQSAVYLMADRDDLRAFIEKLEEIERRTL